MNQAIYLICTGARNSAFRNIKSIAECLADEIMNCAKESSNSYAIKRPACRDLLGRVGELKGALGSKNIQESFIVCSEPE